MGEIRVGEIASLFRYPVKSMRGELLQSAELGWHGLEGDRRLALRRAGDHGGVPWLTASTLGELILFTPVMREPSAGGDLPTHIRIPEGEELPVFGEDLVAEVRRRYGQPVEMIHLKRGIFDDASVSVITSATVDEICRASAQPSEVRRFRPNILIRTLRSHAFQEDEWMGGVLSFGEDSEGPAISVTHHDERCSVVSLDPDSARPAPEVLKAVVRVRDNKVGLYATVTRQGPLAVGQPVFWSATAS
jgi:uncharacterized protein